MMLRSWFSGFSRAWTAANKSVVGQGKQPAQLQLEYLDMFRRKLVNECQMWTTAVFSQIGLGVLSLEASAR